MEIRNVTVVGAGNMGSGIAQAWATAGCNVNMHDMTEEAITRGRERIEGPLRKRVEAGRMKADVVDGIMSRLNVAADFDAAVADADLVVEAVFEDLQVKQDLFKRLDAACPENSILATNTSSFAVSDLAKVTNRPDRVIGLHYFFPAAINKLVEVISAEGTNTALADAVFEASQRGGKIPIRTGDASGFCVNRFFVPWINESCRILEEGIADIPTIEAAAKQAFQIGMGPFELMNVTGVPISLHAQTTLHEAFGPFYAPAQSLRDQVEAGENWNLDGAPDESKFDAVAQRLVGVVYGIACHLVEEDVATIRDTDRGATIGLRWARGPFAMMNLDLAGAVDAVKTIHEAWPNDFAMPASLLEAAGEGWMIPAVTVELDGHVATITFDRPEALNALDENVLRDLDNCLDAIEAAEPKRRAVIVTGSGKAFIAGADIPTMKALDTQGAAAYTEMGHRVLNRLAGLDCPVIVAINGFAFGGGLELALCGDLLYASEKAQLALPEVGLGIHPGFGGTQRLPRRVGIGAAKEMTFTGKTLGPAEAKTIGLVDAVLPHDELMSHCQKIAAEIATKAPLAIAGAKRCLDGGIETDLGSGLNMERENVALLFSSKDKDEGLQAFMERRKAEFVGA